MNSNRSLGSGRRRAARAAFTLFEILLASALSVLLLGLLSMTVHLYLRSVDASRTEVEEAGLARNVLARIAHDLTSTVRYRKPEESPATAFGSASSSGRSSRGSSSSSSGGGSGTESETSEEEESETDESSNLADALEPPQVPGLYGNEYELQIDVNRLPRLNELETMLSGANVVAAQPPSNVKTVTYFIRQGETLTGATIGQDVDQRAQGGLVRRSVDRVATQWAAAGGNLVATEEQEKLFAPEVTVIEFEYFDGVEWLREWDSEEDGLPVAVKVAIAIRPFDADPEDASASTAPVGSLFEMTPDEAGQPVYRLLVHLPLIEPTAADAGGAR